MCEHLLTSIMRHAKKVKKIRAALTTAGFAGGGNFNFTEFGSTHQTSEVQINTRASLLKSYLRPVLLQFTLHLKRQKSAWSTKVTLMAKDSETRQGGQGGYTKWMTLMEREQK